MVKTHIFWKQSDCSFYAEEPVHHTPALSSILFTCSLGVHAERAEIFPEIVPVRFCQAAGPVLDIEELGYVFIKYADLFNQGLAEHHEARLANDVGVETAFEPPLEEFLAVVWARGDVLVTEGAEFLVERGSGNFFLAVILMFGGDETNGGVCFENMEHVCEVCWMPDVVLEEKLYIGVRC